MRTILFAALLALPAAADDLDAFLKNLTVQARMDQSGFSARIATQFQVGPAQVQAVLSNVKEPADAFMIFQMGRLAQVPHDRVLTIYRTHHHKGWGAMAKELGIKPGSPAFHALKRGDFRLEGEGRHREDDRGKKHGKGHGKGHKKDRD